MFGYRSCFCWQRKGRKGKNAELFSLYIARTRLQVWLFTRLFLLPRETSSSWWIRKTFFFLPSSCWEIFFFLFSLLHPVQFCVYVWDIQSKSIAKLLFLFEFFFFAFFIPSSHLFFYLRMEMDTFGTSASININFPSLALTSCPILFHSLMTLTQFYSFSPPSFCWTIIFVY